MGIQERKKREREARRNLIIDSAESVLFEKGLHAMTVDEIAERAELSKPTIYVYFKNKHEIHTAIMLRGFEKATAVYREAETDAENGFDEVKRKLSGLFDLVKEYPVYLRAFLEYSDQSTTSPGQAESKVIKDFYRVLELNLSLLADAIERGKKDGSCRPDLDTWKTVLIIDAATFGMIKFVADPSRKDELELKLNSCCQEVLDYFFNFLEYALRPQSR